MKKNYILAFLFFVLALLSGQNATAQLIANSDERNFNGTSGESPVYNNSLLSNDTLNGYPYIYQLVTVSLVSSTNAGITLNQGYVAVAPGTPAGVYSLVYQICEIANPGNCATATATVFVCNVDAPIIPEPTCSSSPDSLLISGLPATGTWTLQYIAGWNSQTVYITGTGTTYLLQNLTPNYYKFRVSNSSGCLSSEVAVTLGYFAGGLEADTVGTYVDSNNDGIANVGDIVTVQFEITNTLACPITDVTIGQTPFTISGSPVASIAPGVTDTSITGVYVLQQQDINNGSVNDWSAVSAMSNGSQLYTKSFVMVPLGLSDGIILNAFFDNNNNGIQDNGEEAAYVGNYNMEINNNAIHNIYLYNSSYTFYESNPATTYNFSYTPNGFGCYGQYQSNTVYNNITVPAGSGLTVYNFPVTTIPCNDSAIYLYSGSMPRPGFSHYNYVYYGNYGNQPIPSGTIIFTKDSRVTVTSVSEPGAVLDPTGFTCNFTNLQPGEFRYFYIDMDVPAVPAVNMGDLLTHTISMTVPPGDLFANNNVAINTEMVVNSYDPNDISESHGRQIKVSEFSSEDYLTYTIRFENTGNADAINIKINNLLDSQLDASSVRMIASSHDYVLDRSGSNLEWKFNAIHLPPSVSGTMTGKGYLTFQVKPSSYAIGDIIPASADIYFDTNPAITTDPFETQFVSALATNTFEAGQFSVYPNPTNNIVNIELKNSNIETVQVNDVLGKSVFSKNAGSTHAQVDLSNLSNGVYFIKVTAAGAQQTFKIIKE